MGTGTDLLQDPSLEDWLISTQQEEPAPVAPAARPSPTRDPLVWVTAFVFSTSATALALAVVAFVVLL